jgi:CubicO group peptidase (beta-lactamase class C family)
MIVNRIFAVLSALAIIVAFCLFPGCKAAPPSKPVAVPAPPPPSPPPKPRLFRPLVPEAPPLTLALDPRLSRINTVARQAIASGGFPGAVILVGHQGKIVYRKAFGSRAILPQRQPMTTDTIFDLASLTKMVATTTAVMQLVDEGRLRRACCSINNIFFPLTDQQSAFQTRMAENPVLNCYLSDHATWTRLSLYG